MVMNEGIIACEEGQIIKIFRNVARIQAVLSACIALLCHRFRLFKRFRLAKILSLLSLLLLSSSVSAQPEAEI